MSADDLCGFHKHYRRHPEHADCIRIRAVEHILHGKGVINPGFYVARQNGSKCHQSATDKGIDYNV